jgi:putative ATPase
LRDAHYQGAKRLGHGKDYKYAHDFPEHYVAQDYLGAAKRYYVPSDQGTEKKIKERLEKWRALASDAANESKEEAAS